jgi:predicted dehydrogenase
MQPLRGAVVGFGKLGLLHAGLLNGLKGCKLAAVVEPSRTISRAIEQYFPQVSVYDTVAELMAAGHVDLVVVATPTGSHVEIASTLIKAHTPVFIEKPLALTAVQASPLIEALSTEWVPNMVGYMGRYIDTFRHAKSLLAEQVLGRVQMIRSSMYIEQLLEPGSGWRYDPAVSGGGVLITQNSHVIDKLIWLFGDICEVSGHTESFVSRTVEDHAHAYFRFASGATGYLDASWSARHFRTPTISIHAQGENGTLDVSDDEVRLYLDQPTSRCSAGWTTWRAPELYEPVELDIGGPQYTRQMLDFIAAVRSRTSVQSDIPSALKVQEVIDAVYQSARECGAVVRLSA